jgi:hypothetical protein
LDLAALGRFFERDCLRWEDTGREAGATWNEERRLPVGRRRRWMREREREEKAKSGKAKVRSEQKAERREKRPG